MNHLLLIPTILLLAAMWKQVCILKETIDTNKKVEANKYLFFIFNGCVIIGIWNTDELMKFIFFTIAALIVFRSYYYKS